MPPRSDLERPLDGMRVLITRPGDQAEETAGQVRKAGGDPLVCPCLVLGPPPSVAALDRALAQLGVYDLIVWTSVNAVRSVHRRMELQGMDLAVSTRGALIAAVGQKTAEALAGAGVKVALCARDERAEGVFDAIQRYAGPLAGRYVLLPAAAQGRDALARLLQLSGAHVDEVAAYQTSDAAPQALEEALSALRARRIHLVPIGSPRTARVLLSALGADAIPCLRDTLTGAIGQTTALALREAGVRVDLVATSASFDVLLLEMAAALRARWAASGRHDH